MASGDESWLPTCGAGAELYYNDPITNSWQPVCGAQNPVYGNINGEWVPLCCQVGTGGGGGSASWTVGGLYIDGISERLGTESGAYYSQPEFHSIVLVSETLGAVFWNDAPYAEYGGLVAQVFIVSGGVPALVGPIHRLWGWRGQSVIRCITRVDANHFAFIGEMWSGPDPSVDTFAQVVHIDASGGMSITADSLLPRSNNNTQPASGGAGISLSDGRMMYAATPYIYISPMMGYQEDITHVQVITVTATPSSLSFSDQTFTRDTRWDSDYLNVAGDNRTRVILGGHHGPWTNDTFGYGMASGNLLTVSGGAVTESKIAAQVPDTQYGNLFWATRMYAGAEAVSPASGVFLAWAYPGNVNTSGTVTAVGFDSALNPTVIRSYDNEFVDYGALGGHTLNWMSLVAVNGHADVLRLSNPYGSNTLILGSDTLTTTQSWGAIWSSRAQFGSVGAAIINESDGTTDVDFNHVIIYSTTPRGVIPPPPLVGCVPFETISLPTMLSPTSDSSGNFTTHFTTPPSMVGQYVVSVAYYFVTPSAPDAWADFGDGSPRIHLTQDNTYIKKLFYAGEILGSTMPFSWTLYLTQEGGAPASYNYAPTACSFLEIEAVCDTPPPVPTLGWSPGYTSTYPLPSYSSGSLNPVPSNLGAQFAIFYIRGVWPSAVSGVPSFDAWGRHAQFDQELSWEVASGTATYTPQGGYNTGPGTMHVYVTSTNVYTGTVPTSSEQEEIGSVHFSGSETLVIPLDFTQAPSFDPNALYWYICAHSVGDTPWDSSGTNDAYVQQSGVLALVFQSPRYQWVF